MRHLFLLVVGSLSLLALTGCKKVEQASDDVNPAGRMPVAPLVEMFSVRVTGDVSTSPEVILVSSTPTPMEFLCTPEAPRVSAARDFFGLDHCLGQEDPPRSLEKIAHEAHEAVKRQLQSDRAAGAVRVDLDSLHARAREMFAQELQRRGWRRLIERGFARYVRTRAACYREALERQRLVLEKFAAEKGLHCNEWELAIGVCTADSDDLADHIVYHSGRVQRESIRDAIELLMSKALLGDCLARILEADDPDLASQVRRLRAAGASERLPRPSSLDLDMRAWALWRRRGVERWLEEVARTGELSEDLRVKIALCGGGQLPPVVEEAGQGAKRSP